MATSAHGIPTATSPMHTVRRAGLAALRRTTGVAVESPAPRLAQEVPVATARALAASRRGASVVRAAVAGSPPPPLGPRNDPARRGITTTAASMNGATPSRPRCCFRARARTEPRASFPPAARRRTLRAPLTSRLATPIHPPTSSFPSQNPSIPRSSPGSSAPAWTTSSARDAPTPRAKPSTISSSSSATTSASSRPPYHPGSSPRASPASAARPSPTARWTRAAATISSADSAPHSTAHRQLRSATISKPPLPRRRLLLRPPKLQLLVRNCEPGARPPQRSLKRPPPNDASARIAPRSGAWRRDDRRGALPEPDPAPLRPPRTRPSPPRRSRFRRSSPASRRRRRRRRCPWLWFSILRRRV